MIEKTNIPIFFTIDNQYAPYVSCAISSMIENSSKQYHYKIYILHQNLSQDNISKISSLQCENFEIIFKEMFESGKSIRV